MIDRLRSTSHRQDRRLLYEYHRHVAKVLGSDSTQELEKIEPTKREIKAFQRAGVPTYYFDPYDNRREIDTALTGVH